MFVFIILVGANLSPPIGGAASPQEPARLGWPGGTHGKKAREQEVEEGMG